MAAEGGGRLACLGPYEEAVAVYECDAALGIFRRGLEGGLGRVVRPAYVVEIHV